MRAEAKRNKTAKSIGRAEITTIVASETRETKKQPYLFAMVPLRENLSITGIENEKRIERAAGTPGLASTLDRYSS